MPRLVVRKTCVWAPWLVKRHVSPAPTVLMDRVICVSKKATPWPAVSNNGSSSFCFIIPGITIQPDIMFPWQNVSRHNVPKKRGQFYLREHNVWEYYVREHYILAQGTLHLGTFCLRTLCSGILCPRTLKGLWPFPTVLHKKESAVFYLSSWWT